MSQTNIPGGTTQIEYSEVMQERIDDIKMALGYPVVSVHTTDEMIVRNIMKAYRKFTSKNFEEKTIAIPYSGESKIDLLQVVPEGTSIEVVANVQPALASGAGYSDVMSNGDYANEFDWRYQGGLGSGSQLQDMAYRAVRMGNIAYMSDPFDWEYQEPNLYVDNVPVGVYELSVHVLYKPEVDDVTTTWVEEYALALTKITEGRIRSKFQGGPMEFEMDGGTLVDEGRQELEQLEESLKSRSPLTVSRRA